MATTKCTPSLVAGSVIGQAAGGTPAITPSVQTAPGQSSSTIAAPPSGGSLMSSVQVFNLAAANLNAATQPTTASASCVSGGASAGSGMSNKQPGLGNGKPSQIICYLCGNVGHKRNKCPNAKGTWQKAQVDARNKASRGRNAIMATLADQSAALAGAKDAARETTLDIKAQMTDLEHSVKSLSQMVSVIKDASVKPQDPQIALPTEFAVSGDPQFIMWLKRAQFLNPSTCSFRHADYRKLASQAQGKDDVRSLPGLSANMARTKSQTCIWERTYHPWIGHAVVSQIVVSEVCVNEYIAKYSYDVRRDYFDNYWEVLTRSINVAYNHDDPIREHTYQFLLDYALYRKQRLYFAAMDFHTAPSTPGSGFILVTVAFITLIVYLLGRLLSKTACGLRCAAVNSRGICLRLASVSMSTVQSCQRRTLTMISTSFAAFKNALASALLTLTFHFLSGIGHLSECFSASISHLSQRLQMCRLNRGYHRVPTQTPDDENSDGPMISVIVHSPSTPATVPLLSSANSTLPSRRHDSSTQGPTPLSVTLDLTSIV